MMRASVAGIASDVADGNLPGINRRELCEGLFTGWRFVSRNLGNAILYPGLSDWGCGFVSGYELLKNKNQL
jgi:hypothetical protein